ncbi:hypothetical protein, partial [Fulvivirga aurantia]|uniref:hypothetical protein n=1 Tax=Fulvivirga aurantia TaxID=2529383 RepID=UPI00162899DD
LAFELSDSTGFLSSQNYYGQDTIKLSWKLGCKDLDQKIKVIDPSVCGKAKSGCIEVDIFEISARASASVKSGWYTPCLPINVNFDDFIGNDNRVSLLNGGWILTTTDFVNGDWTSSSGPLYSAQASYKLLSNGEMFAYAGSEQYLFHNNEKGWEEIYVPSSSFFNYEKEIVITENGTYYFIEEDSRYIYKSTDGIYWDNYIDISSITNSYGPQGIAVDGNRVVIICGGRQVIDIDASLNTIEVHDFDSYTWNYYSDFSFDLELKGDQLFVLYRSYSDDLAILDLLSNTS